MKSLITLTHSARTAALAAAILINLLPWGQLRAAQQPAQHPGQEPAQQATPQSNPAQASAAKAEPPSAPPASDVADAGYPLPGDWAPELLDGILSSPNPAAGESLYDAAFAAGPGLIPQLQAALKDDRTAEFAAQALAFVGGDKAEQILETLIADRRDLDLRRFYLGSLGEYPAPEIEQLLLDAVAKSDAEPDRTVTEAAIWALTVRSDPGLPAAIQRAEAGIEDVVIRDDLDNARQVIQSRLKYLASPEGQAAGGSLEQAVRSYFIGALQAPAPRPRSAAGTSHAAEEPPAATVGVNQTIFSPDKTRALAHVTFEDSDAGANYDIILQKQLGDWKVVSVWEGAETEEPPPPVTQPAPPRHRRPAPKSARPANVTKPSD